MNNSGRERVLPVNYSGLIPVMIESIKEQQQIDDIKKLVQKLRNNNQITVSIK